MRELKNNHILRQRIEMIKDFLIGRYAIIKLYSSSRNVQRQVCICQVAVIDVSETPPYIHMRCPREACDAGGAESNGEIYVYGW